MVTYDAICSLSRFHFSGKDVWETAEGKVQNVSENVTDEPKNASSQMSRRRGLGFWG